MLLNEFLKEHKRVEHQDRKIQEQEATIVDLKSSLRRQETAVSKQAAAIQSEQKQIQILTASFKEQAEQLQRATANIELGKAGPRQATLEIHKKSK